MNFLQSPEFRQMISDAALKHENPEAIHGQAAAFFRWTGDRPEALDRETLFAYRRHLESRGFRRHEVWHETEILSRCLIAYGKTHSGYRPPMEWTEWANAPAPAGESRETPAPPKRKKGWRQEPARLRRHHCRHYEQCLDHAARAANHDTLTPRCRPGGSFRRYQPGPPQPLPEEEAERCGHLLCAVFFPRIFWWMKGEILAAGE